MPRRRLATECSRGEPGTVRTGKAHLENATSNTICRELSSREVGQSLVLRPDEVSSAAHRPGLSYRDEVCSDLVSGDRANERSRKDRERPPLTAQQLAGELMKLCRAGDRERHVTRLDSPLLRELARVVGGVDAVDPDDRQRDVVRDSCWALGSDERAGGRLEEGSRPAGGQADQIRHVDDRLDAMKRDVEPGTRGDIHTV